MSKKDVSPNSSPISITRFPPPLEDSLIQADYVPWDLTWNKVRPGDVLQETAPSLRTIWLSRDCFKEIPRLDPPEEDKGIEVQTVSLSGHDLSFGLKFLNLAGTEFERNGITGAQISITDLAVQNVPEGYIQRTRARTGSECFSHLSAPQYFAVSAVLYGRINLQFYKRTDTGGKLYIAPQVLEGFGLDGKGYGYDGHSKSWVSKSPILLGVRPQGRTAKDVRERLRGGMGIKKRRLDEEIERSYSFFTTKEMEFIKQMPMLLKELEDPDHTLRYDIVELLLDDIDFSLKEYKGKSIAALDRPLRVLGFAAGDNKTNKLFNDRDPKQLLRRIRSSLYGGTKVHEVNVGTADFHITHAQFDERSFCNDDRPYDFFYLNLIRRFTYLEGLSFIFFIQRDRMTSPPTVVELELRDGLFKPAFGSEFSMDNIRDVYGNEAFRKFFNPTVTLLHKSFPEVTKLKQLKEEEYVGFRVNLLPRHYFAIAFRCPVQQ